MTGLIFFIGLLIGSMITSIIVACHLLRYRSEKIIPDLEKLCGAVDIIFNSSLFALLGISVAALTVWAFG